MTISKLKKISWESRKEILSILTKAKSGHPGGSLSAIDIITTLFFNKMKHDPKNPKWVDRDRFVMSKGHGVPALYVTLAKAGYFPLKDLATLRELDSPLQGHPVNRLMNCMEAPTGSLGQGLSIAQGIAMAGKLDGKSYQVYAMIGDGESQEGQIWETAMSAAKFKLDNLIVFLDYNKGQIDGFTKDVMNIDPIVDKWKSFNWNVHRVDGHDFNQIIDVLDKADHKNEKPTMIVADTIKGKGVSFMENNMKWHGVTPTEEELKVAMDEIDCFLAGIKDA